MDKLEHIFALQKEFQERVKHERQLEGFSQEEWLQKLTLAMVGELAEVLNEVNYKWWKTPRELDQQHIREKLSDVLHFFVCMCLESGMTADDLYETYLAKLQENHRRQDGKSLKPGYAAEKTE